MASKTETCRLLVDPAGPTAERFQHYDAFLNHNHRSLRLLSELEMLDQGAGWSPWVAIQRRAGELVEDVCGLVTSLEGISGGRYAELAPVYEAIADALLPMTTRKRPRRGVRWALEQGRQHGLFPEPRLCELSLGRPAERELLQAQVDRSVKKVIYLDTDHAAAATTGRTGAANKALRKPSSWNQSPTQPRGGSDGQRLDTDIAEA